MHTFHLHRMQTACLYTVYSLWHCDDIKIQKFEFIFVQLTLWDSYVTESWNVDNKLYIIYLPTSTFTSLDL